MATHTIKVLFSETDSAIFPAVTVGFCDLRDLAEGDTIEFEFEENYSEWKSVPSSSDLSDYTISVAVGDFAYKLKANDNDPSGNGPDKGDYDLVAKDGKFLEASGSTITVVKYPSKWDGIEFEYDVTVSGNGKSGTLDPRTRGRR